MSDSRQTRSTLKDFLSSRGSAASTIDLSPSPSDSSPNDLVNEGDDLGVDPNTGLPLVGLRGLASAYVAYITQQEGNLYDLGESGEYAAPTDRGNPIAIADNQGANRVFATNGTTLGQAMQLSNSGLQDTTDYPLNSYLDKTGADPARSGDGLLASVTGRPVDTTGNPEIETYVNNETQSGKMQTGVLQSIIDTNRISPAPGDVAIPNRITSSQIDRQKLQSVQRAFGTYEKDNNDDAQEFSYDQLKDVGSWLLAKAAGYTISGNQDQTPAEFFARTKANSGGSIASVAATLNTQLGADNALTFDDVMPSNASGVPKQASGASMRDNRGSVKQPEEREAKYTLPTPTTYTDETKFSDTTVRGNSRISEARAYIAINALASIINNDIVNIPGDLSLPPNILKSTGPYFMGGSVYSRVNAMNRMMMNVSYVPTRNNYKEAVVAGMGVLIGKKGNGTPAQITGYTGMLQMSPGFWEAVASSAVDIIKKQRSIVDAVSPQYYVDLGQSKAVQVMNVFATVGDIVLQVTGKKFNEDTFQQDIKTAAGIEQVDDLPETAGTRISKSRVGSGRSPLSLSWRGSSLPGLYLLPDDVVKASLQMGNLTSGENPARGMLASSLIDKTYADPNMKGEKARIPGDIVKIIEDKLDAEYVPFYFHDLRTNEIISFHAFLENLSDGFNAQYNSFKSYGRADPIKTYSQTTRTVSLSFTVAATSRDDFDEMWYKVNRLIACVYPKYTPGQLVENGEVKFEQPFSQVIGATPLMRLRVGDVVKSNYSRFNLARFFGIGSEKVDVSSYVAEGTSPFSKFVSRFTSGLGSIYPEKASMFAFYGLFGSPVASLSALPGVSLSNELTSVATSAASNFLVNGFVNPIGYFLMTALSQNPDNPGFTDLASIIGGSDIDASQNIGFIPASIAYLKPRERPYDTIDDAGNVAGKFVARRALKVMVLKHTTSNRVSSLDVPYNSINTIADTDTPTRETRYVVKVLDPSQFFVVNRDGETEKTTFSNIQVTHDDLQPDLGSIFAPAAVLINPLATFGNIVGSVVDTAASAVNISPSSLVNDSASTGVAGFMTPKNNAVVRSFENNKGRGLAGVITQLSFNWLEFNWETDWGARAPMGTKVTISFECIHDLPPGLDASGYMRAPTHNVGSIMNTVAGDPYNDKGVLSKAAFARAGVSNKVSKK